MQRHEEFCPVSGRVQFMPVETCTNWARLLVQVRYDTLFRVSFLLHIFVHDLAAWDIPRKRESQLLNNFSPRILGGVA